MRTPLTTGRPSVGPQLEASAAAVGRPPQGGRSAALPAVAAETAKEGRQQRQESTASRRQGQPLPRLQPCTPLGIATCNARGPTISRFGGSVEPKEFHGRARLEEENHDRREHGA